MKLDSIFAMSVFALFSMISCNSDSENSIETNFLGDYLQKTKFENKVTSIKDGTSAEAGLFFTPTANGKITKLKVKIPDVNSALKITIWQGTTIVKTETVNVTKADTEQVFDIADISLTSGKEYAITMNSGDWYKRNITDESNVTYPITSGFFKINAFKKTDSTTPTLPTTTIANAYYGDLSFDYLVVY
jgi:hypothetical protein